MIKKKIKKQLLRLPKRVGVYKFYDDRGDILYVGKAVDLSSRVSSYFREDHTDRPHIISMIPQIDKIEAIETENEVEAIVLESALIKEYQPPYNIMQKDDKSHAWIYISTHEKLPKVSIVRNIEKSRAGKGRLFGPYPKGRAVRQVFRYIRKLHPFCTCEEPKRPCLYYHMGLCINPKFGKHSMEEYQESINEIMKFLSGNKKRHINELEKQMRNYAEEMRFEKAAKLRDKIDDLKHLGNRIKIRGNKDTEEEYIKRRELVLSKELDRIAERIGVESLERIECYDVSNIQGVMSYGSMVVSENGLAKRSDYRVFKIKEVEGADDYKSLREVLKRRLKHLTNDFNEESLSEKPDMILIDGAKGQLNAVKDLVPDDIVLMGISKGRKYKKKGGRKKDEFWIVRNGVVVPVNIRKPKILVKLRDEAHRFALKHHRRARQKYQKKSVLDDIEGVGRKRRKALMKKFGSIKGIEKAGVERIAKVINNKPVAEKIIEKLSELDNKPRQD